MEMKIHALGQFQSITRGGKHPIDVRRRSLRSGLGHHGVSGRPVEVGGDLAGVQVQQISSYGDLSLAVSAEGQLFGWGNSEYLQLASVTEATQVRPADTEEGGMGFSRNILKLECNLLTEGAEADCWSSH